MISGISGAAVADSAAPPRLRGYHACVHASCLDARRDLFLHVEHEVAAEQSVHAIVRVWPDARPEAVDIDITSL